MHITPHKLIIITNIFLDSHRHTHKHLKSRLYSRDPFRTKSVTSRETLIHSNSQLNSSMISIKDDLKLLLLLNSRQIFSKINLSFKMEIPLDSQTTSNSRYLDRKINSKYNLRAMDSNLTMASSSNSRIINSRYNSIFRTLRINKNLFYFILATKLPKSTAFQPSFATAATTKHFRGHPC